MAKKAYIGVDGVARKIKKGYVGVENFTPRALPSGYTQVEYIQSSGTQYIDTGFKPNNNTRIVVDIELPSQSSYPKALFGARNSTSAAFILWAIDASGFRDDYAGSSYTVSLKPTGRFLIDKNKSQMNVNGKTSAFATSTFQVNYPLTLFGQMESGGVDERMVEGNLYSCQIYDNGTLIRDYIPCINTSGTAGLYDLVNSKFYGNAGSGTFASGLTHQGVARKIKKAYIGIGGVARPCWSGGELAYYGTVTALSVAKYDLAATTVGDYAVFGGGRTGTTSGDSTVNAYNKTLTRSTPSSLGGRQYMLGATTVGDYAVFAGGLVSGSISTSATAYNTSLTKKSATSLGGTACCAATTVGNYALFAGGTTGSKKSDVFTYNNSLTYGKATSLSTEQGQLNATTVGNYALFGGGYKSDVVNAYNASLTRTIPTALSAARYNTGATAVGNYALFAGGGGGTTVDVYSDSLTKTVATPLSSGRGRMGATTIENYAIFAGGGGDFGTATSNAVDVYDESLTKTVATSMSDLRIDLAATTVGNYALFGGGYGPVNTVEAYTIA